MFKSVLRYVLPLCAFTLMPLMASAQKFALIDMEYILKNVPAYERANEQLNQVSKKWQAEVEISNNFVWNDKNQNNHFYAIPTVAAKWTF